MFIKLTQDSDRQPIWVNVKFIDRIYQSGIPGSRLGIGNDVRVVVETPEEIVAMIEELQLPRKRKTEPKRRPDRFDLMEMKSVNHAVIFDALFELDPNSNIPAVDFRKSLVPMQIEGYTAYSKFCKFVQDQYGSRVIMNELAGSEEGRYRIMRGIRFKGYPSM